MCLWTHSQRLALSLKIPGDNYTSLELIQRGKKADWTPSRYHPPVDHGRSGVAGNTNPLAILVIEIWSEAVCLLCSSRWRQIL